MECSGTVEPEHNGSCTIIHTALVTAYGLWNTDGVVSYTMGNNWGLGTILDLVITSLVLQTRAVQIASGMECMGAAGSPCVLVPAAFLPYYCMPVGFGGFLFPLGGPGRGR